VRITRGQVESLARRRAEEGVLSVYIKVDPILGYDVGQPVAKFKGALRRFARDATEAERAALEREKDKVLDYLKSWEPHCRGLALFSCQPAGIWQTFELPVLVPSFVAVAHTAQAELLAQLLEDFPRLAVALLDGSAARIYLGEQAAWERDASITSDVPGRHDQGGWAQARFQRHIEFHETQHLKKVAEELERLYQDEPFKGLVIVGGTEAAREIEELLSEVVAGRVIGRLSADFKQEPDNQILERVLRLATEADTLAEENLVQRIVDSAEAGGRGAVGLKNTLEAVVEGKVDTLAVAEGVAMEGAVCPRCDYFTTEPFKQCPVCATTGELVDDVVDYAVERTILRGGRVKIVGGKAREWLLARGALGALLRYQVAASS
jgi:peptide chain release factor subunit 1